MKVKLCRDSAQSYAGIENDQLYRLMQLADRVSVNLEGPTQERLDALAPKKDFQRELLHMLQLAEQIRYSPL